MLSSRFADESTAFASGVKLGAMTISRKISLSSFAVSSSTGRLKAMTPPKIETGSQALALRNESARDFFDSATPQGLLCLMATVAISENSRTVLSAASASKNVIEGKLFALKLFGARDGRARVALGAVKRRALMRVFAVAHVLDLRRPEC